ncbi:hypothetical protein GCM10008171_21080 [Methylopila jiangsuensis]|uniref:Rieske domain-containing protein n=1 Tax=Methylopila jiangsuensis TaxID=586230 RepID=A0A9W6N3B8_9HYPH|nr:cytochrome P450 [Methylopila jiangsuensis]MDR6286798.1 cytochrome P450/nitrite reductase/ring-hydroxylating ferredoxin subunit [Methylopila jiangsuensis]GLK76854.1 hypothetical protein GCM10008171_21080 [Methylopila jiangsuensis]
MFKTVAQFSELPPETPVHVVMEGIDLVLLRVGDEVALFESRCPHQGAMLHESAVNDGHIVCRAHGWAFDGVSGRCRHKPAVSLRAIPVRVTEGAVLADEDAVRALVLERRAGSATSADAAAARDEPAPMAIDDLPGPKGLPVIGNAHQIDPERLHVVMEDWQRRHGSFFKFKIMGQTAIAVAKPHLIRMVLRERPHNFRRIDTIEAVFEEMGAQGLFSVEGGVWKRQRKVVAQALNARQIRAFFPKLQEITGRLMRRWDRAAEQGGPVDVQADLMRYTVDVTSNLSFNYDMNTIEKEGDVIQQRLEYVFPMISRRVNSAFPYWRYFKLRRDRELDEALRELKVTIDDIIGLSRERLRRDGAESGPRNVIEAMLLIRDEQGALSNEDIFGNVFSLLIAGEDTTANTMVWILHFLSRRPDVFARLRQEADEVLGDNDILPDIETAGRLVYHDAVINEALRLKPVASVWPMGACADVVMDGVAVPAGTPVFLLTRVPTLLDPDGAPALEFDPERWLAKDRHAAHFDNVMVPFGAGPRLCPGRSLALLEIRAVMSMIARRLDLVPDPDGPPVGERFAFTLIPTHVRLIFSGRKAAAPVRADHEETV